MSLSSAWQLAVLVDASETTNVIKFVPSVKVVPGGGLCVTVTFPIQLRLTLSSDLRSGRFREQFVPKSIVLFETQVRPGGNCAPRTVTVKVAALLTPRASTATT